MRAATLLALALALAPTFGLACAREPQASPAGVPAPQPADTVARLRVEVVASYPHDPQAFTQGLEWSRGELWESTGLYGSSRLRRVRLSSGGVEAEAALPAHLFGEGLARVGERLLQLTWQEKKLLEWDAEHLKILAERPYPGEGWGLCYDGSSLVTSDGGDTLVFRDPVTLAERRRLAVTLAGRPVDRLNELECVGEEIYANVWQTDHIVRISAATGRVDAVIDAAGLLSDEERAAADVLNGIAFRPETGTLLLTGKLWPRLFEVKLVPQAGAGRQPG